MEYKDYYKVMGLERGAGQDDIKRAYRKLARKYHPDVSKEPDAEERFKELGEAYEVLKDPEKRAAYDQLGSNWQAGQDFHTPPNWERHFEFYSSGAGGAGMHDFSDFFNELFGRGGGAGAGAGRGFGFNRPVSDRHARMEIALEDAIYGAVRTLSLQTPEYDPQGQGRLVNHTLKVKIPKGIREGQQIRLAGQGGHSPGQDKAGDLYLEVYFKSHPTYRVEGSDLHMQLPITPWEAALGAKVPVPTPMGKVDMKIPEGSSSGRTLRIKGRGIPAQPPGDLYVALKVVVPPADSEQARSLYEEMARKLAFNPRAHLGV